MVNAENDTKHSFSKKDQHVAIPPSLSVTVRGVWAAHRLMDTELPSKKTVLDTAPPLHIPARREHFQEKHEGGGKKTG